MITIHQFPVLSDNYAFLVRDAATGRVATIDTPDAGAILAEADRLGWTITDIWNTHWHPDHAGGNAAIRAATGALVRGPAEVARIAPPDIVLQPGDTVRLGDSEARVIDVSGHTLGHIAFVFDADATAFVGDALFALGCGRLFEGTPEQAWDSLQRLMALPDETILHCAHEYTEANARFCASLDLEDPALTARIDEVRTLRAAGAATVPTRVGLERATNPFVLAQERALRRRLDLPDAPAAAVFAEVRRRKDMFQ